jgi:GrpB-like predicted nucleotidyltransferase (UPF0157 family)
MKFLESIEYQPACHARFAFYINEIHTLLPTARVEHIGSSAIPYAISKGDLDIFVGVEKNNFTQAITSLEELGFKEKKDTLRTDELCMLESCSEDVALQVVVNDSEFEGFLHFRDKLREGPKFVYEYNHLKRSCEGFSQDKYRERKSEFIEHVLKTL